MSRYRTLLLAIGLLFLPLPTFAQLAQPAVIDTWLDASAGDMFFIEMEERDIPIVRLERGFEGRMPGALLVRFSFAIDDPVPSLVREDAHWRWFAAPQGKARAWHGLVGNVLAPKDLVGLRVHKQDGRSEWYVDNSNHNNMYTVWSRKHDPRKDPAYRVETRRGTPDDARFRKATYLGMRDGQLRIELEEGDGEAITRREYLFPLEPMPMKIGIKRFRAEITDAKAAGIRVRVLSGFGELGLAMPAMSTPAP
jgi:hypothetical protein